MNGLEMLLGQYWIIRNENKEQYTTDDGTGIVHLTRIHLNLFKKYLAGN